ncbi:MAG: Lon protease family protein [Flavobacteriaceae bacterium]
MFGLIGQDRALTALQFGTEIAQPSFDMFVLGPPGAGKTAAVKAFLEEKAANERGPDDWVYVYNFETPHKPRALRLPGGRAQQLSKSMIEVIDEIRSAMPAIFEGEEYQGRRHSIEEATRGAQAEALDALNAKAQQENIRLLQTPFGFALAPLRDGKIVEPDVFNNLPAPERENIQKKIEKFQEQLTTILKRFPQTEKERRRRIRELESELAEVVVNAALDDVEADFSDVPDVMGHLQMVKTDLIANASLFRDGESERGEEEHAPVLDTSKDTRFRRFMIIVMIGETENKSAPVLREDNPTVGNLIGRIEHIAQMGALLTDFMLIKPGVLHRANGGYLLLDARKVLMQPFAWEALKRALKAREITIESPAEQYSLISTVSLEPDRIPLRVKVVLFGDREIYYLLNAFDPDFAGLFKVAVDFDEVIDRTPENAQLYARLAASIVERCELRHVDPSGVARLVDECVRLAEDTKKLTLRTEIIGDILREADYWAGKESATLIAAPHVARAVKERIFRLDRIRERVQEAITRDIMQIDTDGEKIGQVNGLSVLGIGDYAFGRPSRITATVRMGSGKVVDIEREVELGGPTHSKGMMILRGFLEGRYAHDVPLSLSANLVFEQSYGMVDGDSASSAELYALLSAIAGVPLRQSIAVTGSVDQHGRVQAIGGVNEKIEGFFDICAERGLTGRQGVMIPKSNIDHLMLREDVVDAATQGKFNVYAVATVEEGIELLSGLSAGRREGGGLFSEGSFNRLVEDRLIAFAHARQQFGLSGSAAVTGRRGDAD